jgi:hypothetical protein
MAQASDHTDRNAGVPRRAEPPADRSRCVRANVNNCGNAAMPAPRNAAAMRSSMAYLVVVVSAR